MIRFKVDDHIFYGEFKDNTVLVKIDALGDLFFFTKWYGLVKSGIKVDYCKVIQYRTNTSNGELIGCFPLVDPNEKYVLINFDMKRQLDSIYYYG